MKKSIVATGLAPKVISLFLSLVMLVSITAGIDFSACAAGNSIQTATSITLGRTYNGSITQTNEKDVYKFTMSASGRINISLKANIKETCYYLYDANGVEICNWRYCYWNDNTQQMKLNETVDLSKGTYYFAVVRHNGTGNYNFSICCHTCSCTITKQPTCTANGTRTYTCKNCNAKRTESIPALGHKYTTKVVKPTYTSEGYTLHTCTRCKKKYYVRVRTYKTVKVNGKNTKVYSSWSKVKTVKTK